MATKEPATKLPLAVRKNVRDGWENKKTDLESQISALLDTPWKFEINPLVVYPYAAEDSYGHHSLGDCINAYAEALIWRLKSFLSTHEEGKEELNTVASTHTIALSASEKFNYCGTEFVDGVLKLVFHPNNLGTNINDVAAELLTALSSAPSKEEKLSFVARAAVKNDYDPKIGQVLEKARGLLQNNDFKFEVDFEGLGKALKGGKGGRDDWESNLGGFARGYLEGFVDVLEREGFGKDDMLREGFQEAVTENAIGVRVLESIKGSYNEIVLEDGKAFIQTTPENWGTNIHNAAEKLMDLL